MYNREMVGRGIDQDHSLLLLHDIVYYRYYRYDHYYCYHSYYCYHRCYCYHGYYLNSVRRNVSCGDF
jgi:hypothetical protein